MKKSLFVLFFFMNIYSCKTSNCDDIPDSFHSYKEAIDVIKNRSFNFRDSLVVDNGSFLSSASYYSCDKKSGYLFYKRKYGGEYFVSEVPITVWKEFKKSKDREAYYSNTIENKYSSIGIMAE